MPEFDWTLLTSRLLEHRLALETMALVLTSAIVGFVLARALYKGQVSDRSEILRRASATWRRRLAQGQRATGEIVRERDRANRFRRQHRRDVQTGA